MRSASARRRLQPLGDVAACERGLGAPLDEVGSQQGIGGQCEPLVQERSGVVCAARVVRRKAPFVEAPRPPLRIGSQTRGAL